MGKTQRVTPRQKRYVEEYHVDYNQTAAAIRAGYSPKSAKDIAADLMKNPNIIELIELKSSQLSARLGINQLRIRKELASMAFANVRNFVDVKDGVVTVKDLGDISEIDTAAIQEITVTKTKNGTVTRMKLAEKKGPLELLGKTEGMFKDKLEIDVIGDVSNKLKSRRERLRNVKQ